MHRFVKWFIGCVAIAGIGIGTYAQSVGNRGLLLIVMGIFVLLLSLSYILRMFRARPTPLEALDGGYDDIEAYRNALNMEAPEEEALNAEFAEADAETEDELYLVFARLAGVKTGLDFKARIARIIEENHLSPLSADEINRLADQIDDKDLRGKSYIRTAGVAFARQVRADIDVDYAGTSWIGGTPTLDDRSWPRDLAGRAMHHLAQIDLATLPVAIRPEGLPDTGALAFFMTVCDEPPYQAKVIYLPKIGSTAADPPDDLLPIYDGPHWGKHVKGHEREGAPVTFPRWPMEMVPLPMAHQNRDDDARQVIADLFPQQGTERLMQENYRESLPEFNRPWFWDTAHRTAHSIRLARTEIPRTTHLAQQRVQDWGHTYQADLDTIRKDDKAFSQFVDEVSAWAVSHEPWDLMTDQDADMLEFYFEHVREPGSAEARFEPFYKGTSGELLQLREATEATLMAAVNAPPEVFAKLPRIVRDDVDAKHRLASKTRWHQMFGLGSQFKSAVLDHTHHHLLLQLHSDQLANWAWDDAGVVQFWISEEALRAEDWASVEVTFESH